MTTSRIPRTWCAILLTITIIFFCLPAYAKYSGGTGEPNDPYKIATAEDLMLLGETPEDYGKHFILTADIDLDPNLPGRKVFDRAVIDTGPKSRFQRTSFTGVFDGNDHTISNMTIEGGSYLGLFGTLGSEAEIKSVGVIDVNIVGSYEYVGCLAGMNYYGNVTDCYSTGAVSGSGWYVGGLVGANCGEVTNCYSASKVRGDDSVGGLVGANQVWYGQTLREPQSGLVTRCYSTGTVSGEEAVGGLIGVSCGWVTNCYSMSSVTGSTSVGGLLGANGIAWFNMGVVRAVDGLVAQCYSAGAVCGDSYVGGLIGTGRASRGTIETGIALHSVWDMDTSGLSGSNGGVGLTTAEMMNPKMLGLNGFANDPNWVLDSGCDYPRLAWQDTPGSIIPEPIIDLLEGSGTAEDPYRIDTAEQLVMLSKAPILWASHFVLGADIDLDPNLPGRSIFGQPLIQVFTGVFNGNGHKLSHLTITGERVLGLFGRLSSTGKVSNLGLESVEVRGTDYHYFYIGGLVGYNDDGNIDNCYCTGSVSGGKVSYKVGLMRSSVGGLVGYSSGRIGRCYSTSTVSGEEDVGRLVGINNGNVICCYTTSTVTGEYDVGGLVGLNSYHGSIVTSYNTGSVTGGYDVGGLVGYNLEGNITTSYSIGTVSSATTGPFSSGGGLVGFDRSGAVTSSFWDIETSGCGWSDGGTGKTTAEMQTASTFLEAGWDFVGETANGTDDIWWINEGHDYPRLWWEADNN